MALSRTTHAIASDAARTLKRLRRVPLMPLAGLAITLVAGIAALFLSLAVARANRWIAHTIRTEVAIERVGERLATFESGYRGYMVRANPVLLRDAVEAHDDLRLRLRELRTETSDNPVQRRNLDALTALIDARLGEARHLVGMRPHMDAAMLDPQVTRTHGRELMAAIRARSAAMFAEEERLLARRQRWVELCTIALALGLAGAVVLVVVVAYLTVNDARERYAALERAHSAINAEMERREAAETALRHMQKMETIGQLTGGIAHDFNNMLAVVIGSLDLAQHGAHDPARVQRSIAAAMDGAARAATLVSRLLAFSRRQPLSPVAIDANRLVAGMSDLLRRTLGERVSVEIDLAADPWACFADPSQLETAIVNLAVNARDAIGADGGRVTIRTRNVTIVPDEGPDRVLDPGDYVLIGVSDTGPGMPPEVIGRAFDPFFTTKDVGKGTGLGLSQVFGFASQSGGHAAIESMVGRGTDVLVYLPRHHGKAIEPKIAADAPLAAGAADEVILVAEDEPQVRQLSVAALRELGYTVLAAANGEEALTILDQQPRVTLLFSDIVMPGMTGRALAREALRRRPDLRLLYTSGYSPDQHEPTSSPDGAGALLPKPFTLTQLAQRVRAALDTA